MVMAMLDWAGNYRPKQQETTVESRWLPMIAVLLILGLLGVAAVVARRRRRGGGAAAEAKLWRRPTGGQEADDVEASEVSSFIEARDAVKGSREGRSGGALSPLTSLRSHDPISRESDGAPV